MAYKDILKNDMEDTNNSFDSSAIVEELEKINTSVASGNKKIDELTEYFITKDAKEKALAEKQAKETEKKIASDQEAQEQADLEAQEQADLEAQEQEELNQTYTELLIDIRDQTVLTNQLLAVQGVFIGIVIGLLFMKSIFDRIFK